MQIETVQVGYYFLPIVLNFQEIVGKISDDEFENFCRHNPDVELELTKEGELVIMPPTGGETGIRNFTLIGNFFNWLEKEKAESVLIRQPFSFCRTAQSVRLIWRGRPVKSGML